MTARRSAFWPYPPCACPKCRERSGRPKPSTMAVENRARISEARTVAAPASVPLGSEIPCEACGKTIVKTRRSRRFCSDLCRDVSRGRRKAAP